MGTRSITYEDANGIIRTIESESDDLFGFGTVGTRPASGDFVGDLWLLDDGAGRIILQRWNGSSWGDLTLAPPSGGSVDNRLARFDGTGGQVQISGIDVDDNDAVTGVERVGFKLTTGDVAAPANGQVWYNNTTGKLRGFESGSAFDLVDAGTGQTLFDAIVPTTHATPSAAFSGGAKSVFVRSGTVTETANIVVPDGGMLVGEDGDAIIDLSGGFQLQVSGAGAVETAGTIAFTNGSAAVVGTGTTFTNLAPGDYIGIGAVFYEILSITDATNLTLVEAWTGRTRSGFPMLGLAMNSRVLVQDIKLDGGGVAATGVLVQAMRESVFKNVVISDCADDLQVTDCGSVVFEDVVCEFSTNAGCDISRSRTIRFDTCHFAGNGLDGANVNTSSLAIKFDGCEFDGNGGDGLDITGSSTDVIMSACGSKNNAGKGVNSEPGTIRLIIQGGTIEFNGGDGVDFDGQFNLVSGCAIGNNGGFGIQGGDDGVITGNYIHDNTGNGINLTADVNVTISGNRIDANGGDGINVPATSADCTIIGNQITSNTGTGLLILAGATGTQYWGNIIQGNTVADLTDGGTSTRALEHMGLTKLGQGITTLDSVFEVKIQTLAAGGTSGLLIAGGEAEADIALRITDQDGSLQILDVHADDGQIVQAGTYSGTLAANGTVFGYDLQFTTGGARQNFNAQAGSYYIGQVRANGAFSVYDNVGGQTFTTTPITINLDTTKANSGDDGFGTFTNLYTLASNVLTVNVAGTYLIMAQVGVDVSSGNSRSKSNAYLEVDTGAGFNEVDGSRMLMYNRQASEGASQGALSLVLEVAAGDDFRLRVVRTGGSSTLQTRADATRLTFVRLC